MSLWSQYRSLHWGWQLAIAVALLIFYPLLYIVIPVLLYSVVKEKTGSTRVPVYGALLVFCLIVAVVVGITTHRQSVEMEREQQRAAKQKSSLGLQTASVAPSSAVSSQPVKPANPRDRIIALVGKYGEYPLISNLNNINAKNPLPPYEVIVVMDNVKSCFSAKEKAQKIMYELYFDPVAGPAIIRVKAINNEYVSASLGATDARRMHKSLWPPGGPTNFINALQGQANYDMDMVQDATSATAASYTYAELGRGCR